MFGDVSRDGLSGQQRIAAGDSGSSARRRRERRLRARGVTSSRPSQWHWRWPLTTAHNEVWRDLDEAPREQKSASAAGQRPSVLKERQPQGEIARVRMTEVSGLPHPGYVPQLHGDEGDAEFIQYVMAGTWDCSRLVELAGPQARDLVPQLAAQLVDVPNVDIAALQVNAVFLTKWCFRHVATSQKISSDLDRKHTKLRAS